MEHALLTRQQLADILQVHEKTLLRWMKKGMPHMKVENTTRFDLEEVKGWMKPKEVKN